MFALERLNGGNWETMQEFPSWAEASKAYFAHSAKMTMDIRIRCPQGF